MALKTRRSGTGCGNRPLKVQQEGEKRRSRRRRQATDTPS